MKYEGIVGSATGKYNGWIELESCQLGNTRAVRGFSGIGATSPSISEIVITKYQDSSSPHLFTEALSGKQRKVTIDFVEKEQSAPYLSIELEGVLISGYSTSGGGAKPYESLSLNFTKITYSTKPTAAPTDSKTPKNKAVWNNAVK